MKKETNKQQQLLQCKKLQSKPWKPMSSYSKSDIANVAVSTYSVSLTFCFSRSNSYSVSLLFGELCHWTRNIFVLFGWNAPKASPSSPMQSKALRWYQFNRFLQSVFICNILKNILSNLAFVKRMTSNNLNMCNHYSIIFLFQC